jgi:hypothetical protein
MANNEVYERQRRQIKELQEAIVMADNRLEAALIGDSVCRRCVEVAKSYLVPFVGREY